MEEYDLKDSDFVLFRDLIYKVTGISLSDAKRQLVKSRLQKRLRFHSLPSYRLYYDMVVAQGETGSELTELVNCITTNKTDFYREPHHFEFVTQTFLPEMAERIRRGLAEPKLRIWHAGCSTGEEPYTLAITLREAMRSYGNWDVRQLASDIDTDVLAHAERGVYDRERVAPVPEPLLRRYFLSGSGTSSHCVRVKPELRDQITFRRINLLDERWPVGRGKVDLLFCRNVVIYFDKPTRQKLFARYAEAIRPGGYLIIGHSESLLGINDQFESLGKTIYRLPEQGAARPGSLALARLTGGTARHD